eukprot:1187114-Prorocentrum_minimum.AAC.3
MYTKQAHAARDPVRLRLEAGQVHIHHEVGGVARGGQGPPARAGLVHRAVVAAAHPKVRLLARLQPQRRACRI